MRTNSKLFKKIIGALPILMVFLMVDKMCKDVTFMAYKYLKCFLIFCVGESMIWGQLIINNEILLTIFQTMHRQLNRVYLTHTFRVVLIYVQWWYCIVEQVGNNFLTMSWKMICKEIANQSIYWSCTFDFSTCVCTLIHYQDCFKVLIFEQP